MPGLYKDEGVVLKTIKLGEADRIVTLFTREHGKVRAVAKGIRKTKSRFGGRLEPFTRVNLMLYKGRGDLDTVTSAEIIDAFQGVHFDFDRLTAASALVELTEKMTPDREQAFSTYALLIAGLGALAADRGSSIVPAFLVKLLAVSGYHPELRVCAGCGDEGPLGGFSPSLGGAVCRGCWQEDNSAFGIPPDHVALIDDLLNADFGILADAGALAEVTQALRRYAEHHLERPLKSLQLLKAV
jgi:DNA repair protein RecO (recombination protein O)